jgi:hypothetical protein
MREIIKLLSHAVSKVFNAIKITLAILGRILFIWLS